MVDKARSAVPGCLAGAYRIPVLNHRLPSRPCPPPLPRLPCLGLDAVVSWPGPLGLSGHGLN